MLKARNKHRLLVALLWSTIFLSYAEGNDRFDPDTFVPADCKIPPYQAVDQLDTYFIPTEGVCNDGSSAISLEEMEVLAVEYAPVVFFHPLEPYTMSNVDDTFANPDDGEILFSGDFLTQYDDQLNVSRLFESSRGFISGMNGDEYFFRHKDVLGYASGAGYDAEGLSRAPIYYNVFDSGNGTVTFNYFLYYAYNGEANFALLSSTNNRVNYIPFHLPPFGIHEGDFEAVSVIVCKSQAATQPLAVSYRQHGWNQVTDCTAGECNFYKDTNHPVGFAALHSHATYPVSTANLIYTTINLPFFVNLQGFFVVDRTLYKDADGSYNYFSPDATNVIKMKDPELITAADPEAWQAFSGRWGNSVPIRSNPGPPNCFNIEQTAFVPCPTQEEDPVFHFVMEFMGVYNTTKDSLGSRITSVTSQISLLFSETHASPTGPATKGFFLDWLPPVTNIFYLAWPSNTSEAEFCADIRDIPDTSRLPIEIRYVDVGKKIGGMFFFVLIIGLVNLVTVIYFYTRRTEVRALLEFDEDGNIQEPSWHNNSRIFFPFVVFAAAYFVSLIGELMFLSNVGTLFEVLEGYIKDVDWDSAKAWLQAMGTIALLINTLLFSIIWFPSRDLWLRVRIKYCEIIQDALAKEKYESAIWWNSKIVGWAFAVFFVLLFWSMLLSVLCLVVGVALVGVSYGTQNLCQNTIGSIDDTCFDLNLFGIERITCGDDFIKFCNDFNSSSQIRALWGTLLAMTGIFYLIASTAATAYQQRSESAALESIFIGELAMDSAKMEKEEPMEEYTSG